MTTLEIIVVCWLAFVTGGMFAVCQYVVKKNKQIVATKKELDALGLATVLLIESVKKNESGPLN